MELNEFKDRLFDLINESSDLPVSDIAVNDRENTIKVYLQDHSVFTITCSASGKWFVLKNRVGGGD